MQNGGRIVRTLLFMASTWGILLALMLGPAIGVGRLLEWILVIGRGDAMLMGAVTTAMASLLFTKLHNNISAIREELLRQEVLQVLVREQELERQREREREYHFVDESFLEDVEVEFATPRSKGRAKRHRQRRS